MAEDLLDVGPASPQVVFSHRRQITLYTYPPGYTGAEPDTPRSHASEEDPMNAIETIVRLAPPDAEAAARAALADEGFGVLTEIDVAAVFQAKLGVERPFLKILGACNPGFAQRVLQIDPSVSLLLPCNVVIEDVGEGTKISAVDPLGLIDDPAFTDLGVEVSTRLRHAIDAVSNASQERAASLSGEE
jgi:uncharacterized protein (DUF302 family)